MDVISALVRGCESKPGGLDLGCNDIDFYGTIVHVCLCQTDSCNDHTFGKPPAFVNDHNTASNAISPNLNFLLFSIGLVMSLMMILRK